MHSFSPSLVLPKETSCWRKIPTALQSFTQVKGEFGPKTEPLELPGDCHQPQQIISYQREGNGKEAKCITAKNSFVSKY